MQCVNQVSESENPIPLVPSWLLKTSLIRIFTVTLVVWSTYLISTTEGSEPHCLPPYDSPPCECDTQWYGLNCSERCSSTCSIYGCNKVTGECVSCKAGYHSSNCSLECPPNCLNESEGPARCGRDTGHCTNCQPTWWGSECMNKCDSNCQNEVCDFMDGHCHECKEGKTGENCSEECPSGCLGRLCHRDKKTCIGGCSPGYFGATCDEECGGNCKEVECPANGITGASGKTCTSCLQNTGQCYSCKSGYWGDMCDKLCPKQCPGCSQSNASCSNSDSRRDRSTGSKEGEIAGSVTTVIILAAVVAVIIFFVYKKRLECNSLFGRCRRRGEADEADESVTQDLAPDARV